MAKSFIFILLFFGIVQAGYGQKEAVEEFIISVTTNYKNPLANYPLRQDIFLPTEEELDQLEKERDRPDKAVISGSFIFLDKDAPLNRAPFVTSSGELMFANTKYRGLSKKSSLDYHQRRQKLLMKKHVNLGRFLWYNRQFKQIR